MTLSVVVTIIDDISASMMNILNTWWQCDVSSIIIFFLYSRAFLCLLNIARSLFTVKLTHIFKIKWLLLLTTQIHLHCSDYYQQFWSEGVKFFIFFSSIERTDCGRVVGAYSYHISTIFWFIFFIFMIVEIKSPLLQTVLLPKKTAAVLVTSKLQSSRGLIYLVKQIFLKTTLNRLCTAHLMLCQRALSRSASLWFCLWRRSL